MKRIGGSCIIAGSWADVSYLCRTPCTCALSPLLILLIGFLLPPFGHLCLVCHVRRINFQFLIALRLPMLLVQQVWPVAHNSNQFNGWRWRIHYFKPKMSIFSFSLSFSRADRKMKTSPLEWDALIAIACARRCTPKKRTQTHVLIAFTCLFTPFVELHSWASDDDCPGPHSASERFFVFLNFDFLSSNAAQEHNRCTDFIYFKWFQIWKQNKWNAFRWVCVGSRFETIVK